MDAKVQRMADAIVENRDILYPKMLWETGGNDLAIMSGMLLANQGITADVEKYLACKKLLKQKVSLFSEFRGIAKVLVTTKMMLQNDPETYLDGAVTVYKKLRQIHKLTASPYMVMAAITLYEYGGVERADENIEKLESLYKTLKTEHPLLISDEDRGYLAMMVTQGKYDTATAEEIEQNFQACKKLAISNNAVHSLAQIMVFSSGSVASKAAKIEALKKGLAKQHKAISTSYGLSSLGALTMLENAPEELVEEIAEVDDYIKTKKGFKWYYVSGRVRRIYAALIVFMALISEEQGQVATEISNTLTMVLVEELVMLIVIATMSASTAARSNSSGS